MNTNNDVWREVAKGRSQDAQRWKQQKQLLKQARAAEPKPNLALVSTARTAATGLLAAAHKVLADRKPAMDDQHQPVLDKSKTYAQGHG